MDANIVYSVNISLFSYVQQHHVNDIQTPCAAQPKKIRRSVVSPIMGFSNKNPFVPNGSGRPPIVREGIFARI